MKLDNLTDIGLNQGDPRRGFAAHDLALGSTLPLKCGYALKTAPCGIHAKAFSDSNSNGLLMPSSLMQRIESVRRAVVEAVESGDRDTLTALDSNPDITEVLKSKLLNNERYALRNAVNTLRRADRRKARREFIEAQEFVAEQTGTRLDREAILLEIPQSTQDRLGAQSDKHGDTSRRRAIPIDD